MDKYIQPITKIFTSFNEAKDDVDQNGNISLFVDDREILSISDLAQGNRNLIVGEPGIGKTELLKKFKEHHDTLGDTTCVVNLRVHDPIERIDSFLKESTSKRKVLILDALDEVRAAIFPNVLQKIETIVKENPNLVIYLSSRWIFVSKYAASFPEFRFIRILPFSTGQVRQYLVRAGNSETDVDALLVRIMNFNHGKLLVQVPRYLFLLVEFIKSNGIASVSQVSRNDLFEHFIYSKLDIEDKNLNTDTKAIIKRILEKLALTMEIYQANSITKDELMTFFDDIQSDLKLSILSHTTLDVLYAKTILQESKSDLSSVEFENAEFQEYLAAKEITRFPEPHRVAFSFAVEENIDEILPSWFNTLTFLVDMVPGMLEQLLEFSGLRSGILKIADEGFLSFLSRVNTNTLSPEFRSHVFMDVMSYHEKTLQWLPGQLAHSLHGFFNIALEADLKRMAESAEKETENGASRFVRLGNVAYAVAYLLEAKVSLDKPYWREKLILYTNDKNENGVLQRHALLGIEKLCDASVIDELPNLLLGSDELVAREFVSTCIALDPDNPKSVEYAIQSVKNNELSGRHGLFEMKKKTSITTFLKAYIEDEQFRKEFLDDVRIFGEQDFALVENIAAIFDDEIAALCKEVIVKSIESYLYRSIDHSAFVNGLIRLLRKHKPGFIPDIVRQLHAEDEIKHALYFSQETFARVLEKDDIIPFLDTMIELSQQRIAMDTMIRIKHSKRDGNEEMFELGRSKLATEYADWEAAIARGVPVDKSRDEKTIKEFRKLLEPSKGQFNPSVFNQYVHATATLDPLMTKKDKDRLITLVTGSSLNQDPTTHGYEIISENPDGSTQQFKTSQLVQYFGEALRVAQILGVDITPFRKNIALYIPFAYSEDLKTIFELVPNFTPDELGLVVAVYRDKKDDLWRNKPESLTRLVQQYHLTEGVPVLRDFIKELRMRVYEKCEALRVADSLMPDPAFLKEIFDRYIGSETEREIAYVANGLLITSHADPDAIAWRLEEIKKRPFASSRMRYGVVHDIGPNENELRHDKPFAKPLTELKYGRFEAQYLELLDSAIDVWSRGKEFQEYAQYMWEITYSYFDNLKEYRDYAPLKMLEEKIETFTMKDGVNWLASNMVRLRRSYITYLGKPKNFSEAIRKYNEARAFDEKKIRNSADLFRQLQDVISTELRQWVEYDGAYNIIVSKKKYAKENKEYEKLIQMTIGAVISDACRGRGFKIDLAREQQKLDGKKTDFIVRYGFVGPIVLEVKLGSSSDVKMKAPEKSES